MIKGKELIERFDRIAEQHYYMGQEMRKTFRDFIKANEQIEFDGDDEPCVHIYNSYANGVEFYVHSIEACPDGRIGMANDDEEDCIFDDDLLPEDLDYLMSCIQDLDKE